MVRPERTTCRAIAVATLSGALVLAMGVPALGSFAALGEPTLICDVESQQHLPSVGGRTVVWQDERFGRDDIFARDLVTGVERVVCAAAGSQGRPRTDGTWAVWEDARNGVTTNVYAANLVTGAERAVSPSSLRDSWSPDVDAGRVVWSDTRNGDFDIYAYDLATGVERAVCATEGAQVDPAISGDRVVWQDQRTSAGAWGDIYAFDLATGVESEVCTDSAIQQSPAIAGDWVVWQDYRNDNYDIYAFNMTTREETAVCTAPGDQCYPRVSGTTVVWEDHRGADADVYAYDLATGVEYAVCTQGGDQVMPDVSGAQIVWQQTTPVGSLIAGSGPRPAYDAFGSARTMSGPKGTLSGAATWGATHEAGEPKHAGVAGASSLWFAWKAPDSGTATIDLAGSTFDTLLGVYAGSTPASLTAVASNDNVTGSTRSRVSFSAVKGRVYRIAVDGKGGSFGSVKLAWALRASVGKPRTPSRVSRGSRFTISGTMRPKHSGRPSVYLYVQRYSKGAWRTALKVKASTRAVSGATAYSARVRLSTRGSWRVFARHSDSGHTTSDSARRTFSVR